MFLLEQSLLAIAAVASKLCSNRAAALRLENQFRDGNRPFKAMLKLMTRNGFMIAIGSPLPVGATVPLTVVVTPCSGTGEAPSWSE